MPEQKKIEVEKASIEQLRHFAHVVLQIETHEKNTRQQVIGKIKAAGWGRDAIPVFETADIKRSPAGMPSSEAAEAASRFEEGGKVYYRILIPVEDKPGGEDPVPVGVNGKTFYIPRGEPHKVPAKYVEVLKNAVSFVYDEYTEGKGGLAKPREVLSYPFSFV